MGTVAAFSVGGTLSPVKRAMLRLMPEIIVIYTSKKAWVRHRRALNGSNQEVRPFLIANPENIKSCVVAAHKMKTYLSKRRVRNKVIIDITGGTKPMVFALGAVFGKSKGLLAYTGGAKRGKRGLGRVAAGSERLIILET